MSPTNGRAHVAMHFTLGCIAALGVAHMSGEWRETLAVWSYGRVDGAASLPHACIVVAFASALAFTAGLWWRLAGLAFCASLAALYALAPVTYHNNVYALWLFVLLTVLTGHPRYAPRALFSRDSELASHTPLLPQLVRAQLAIIYVFSVLVKATHPLWQGTGAALRWLAFVRIPEQHDGFVNALLQPLLARPPIAALLDHATLVTELAIPLLLFSPRWRRAGLALGVVLHGFLQAWLFPQMFTFLMVWGYQAFVPAGDRAWRLAAPPTSLVARVVPRLDWLARTTLSPGDTLTLTEPDGRVHHGLSALRWLSALTPATLLLFATLSLAAPSTRHVFGAPRDLLEDVVLLGYALFWLPELAKTLRPDTTLTTTPPPSDHPSPMGDPPPTP